MDTPNSSNAFLLASTNFLLASKLSPSWFHFTDNSSIAATGLYTFSATDLYHSSCAFLASFALPTKWDTRAINAEMPARIQPNTGMDLIAAPTIRNAPARLIFAAVPAVAAAACAPVATVFAPWAAVFIFAAAVPAACAVAFAVSAVAPAVFEAVFATWETVLASIAAVSAICFPRPTSKRLFHHSFALFKVTRENAESLFKVCATCCNPIVIDIRDCTFNIIFCNSSFSAPNKATAPWAAVKPPTTP